MLHLTMQLNLYANKESPDCLPRLSCINLTVYFYFLALGAAFLATAGLATAGFTALGFAGVTAPAFLARLATLVSLALASIAVIPLSAAACLLASEKLLAASFCVLLIPNCFLY